MTIHVLIASHTYTAAINHAKLRALADRVALTAIAPRQWPDPLFRLTATDSATGYQLHALPVWFAGRVMRYFYSPAQLTRVLDQAQPQVVYVEAEPPSVALAQFAWLKSRHHYRLVAFTWENTDRQTRLLQFEQYNLARCDGLIAGNHEAAQQLKRRGYRGPVTVTPQLGLNPDEFRPGDAARKRAELDLHDFTVGFIGRLAPEKGLRVLCKAVGSLPRIQLLLVGQGPLQAELGQWAAKIARIKHVSAVPHAAVPDYLRACDVIVLPSLSTSGWKEQFGHILIEAMACGVPVIGSDSGAIPEVIGEAGVIVRENDSEALRAAILRLHANAGERARLADAGRARVLAHFTQDRIAAANVAFFQQILAP